MPDQSPSAGAAAVASMAPGAYVATAASAGHLPHLADDLHLRGWAEQRLFLPEELRLALAAECRALGAVAALRPASVGRGKTRQESPSLRGDRIAWLRDGQSAACDHYLGLMEQLRVQLNRELYLGLAEFETHFACYPPGAGYQRHLDRFRDDDSRTISAVLYLNDDWLPGQGGALRLYPQRGATIDLAPLGCRLVLFLSADMPHEVLPASRERLSLAGWFRRRG